MKRPSSQFSTLALLWFRCLLAFLHLIPSSLFAWHRYFGVLERNTKTWWMRYADPQKECPGYNLLVKENQRLHTFWVDQYNGYEFPHRRPAWSFHKGGPLRFNTWSFFKINAWSFFRKLRDGLMKFLHSSSMTLFMKFLQNISMKFLI